MKNALLAHVESKHLKAQPPQFDVGDIVDVHQRIVEGDKERIQVFSGTVIMRKGDGINASFTVRRIVNNEGVERIFPLHSPKIEKLEVKRKRPRPPRQALLSPRAHRQGHPPQGRRADRRGRTASGHHTRRSARGRRRGQITPLASETRFIY